MSRATRFDTEFYLSENQDVADALFNGTLESSIKHFELFGVGELRAPNDLFSPVFYLEKNSDVADAVENGIFDNSFLHYQLFGERENRAPSISFEGFNESTYLSENSDVAFAVGAGIFQSAIDHFISFGQNENRNGAFVTVADPFVLTDQKDDFSGTIRDDAFVAGLDTLQLEDELNGNGGNDKLSVALGLDSSQVIQILSSNVSKISFDFFI